MIPIDSVYKIVVSVYLNKNQSGALSPDDFNTAAAAINYDFLKWRVGLPEMYTVGNPSAPIAYQVTQKITDDVRQFIVIANLPKQSNGYFTIPSDYFAYSSLRYLQITNSDQCDGEPTVVRRTIEIVDDGELGDRLDNTIIPPQEDYPIGAYYSYGLKVYPETIKKIQLTYLKTPITPFWNYTISPLNDQPVYNASGSQDFDYPESCLGDICILILKMIGVNLQMNELVQYGLVRQKEGV